jgi:hypothetical protein
MPLVIAEYGLPTSRGVSHFAPLGFNQGGHNEEVQAELSKILTEDIVQTKCAGAIYFEWADEWFKHNWLVMDFEQPFKNRKQWHNMENPEQNFGILALEDRRKTIDGKMNDWKELDTLSQDVQMQNFADATYFYVAAHLPSFDFNKNNLYIAIDTYDKEKGDHKLPFTNKVFDNGFEFLVKLNNINQARILVDEPYSVFTDIYNNHIPVYTSKYNNNGKFINELMLVNRGRETLTGEKTDSIINNRSILQFGNSTIPSTSNADWFYNPKTHNLELRLDWHLINVSDPSQRYVLNDKEDTREIEHSQTEGFNIYMFVTDKKNKLIKQYPEGKPQFFSWENWDNPVYTQRKKPLYDTLQDYFSQNLTVTKDRILPKIEKFEITDFYMDKPAAVSISFDEQSYSQYLYAYPELKKYELTATFSIIPQWDENKHFTKKYNDLSISRMGKNEWKILKNKGFEIAALCKANPDWDLLRKKYTQIRTLHTQSKIKSKISKRYIFIRNNTLNTYNGIEYQYISSMVPEKELYQTLQQSKGKWSIINFKNIYKDTLSIQKLDSMSVEKNFVPLEKFKRQIRLIRNSDYWIDTEQNIFKYLFEKQNTKLNIKKFGDITFLQLETGLNSSDYDFPLSIRYTTSAKSIRVSSSQSDGVYNNRKGSIIINVIPGKEVRIEKIK